MDDEGLGREGLIWWIFRVSIPDGLVRMPKATSGIYLHKHARMKKNMSEFELLMIY